MSNDRIDLPVDVVLDFKCGCRYFIIKDSNSLDGLSCCNAHEAPHQKLEKHIAVDVGKGKPKFKFSDR